MSDQTTPGSVSLLRIGDLARLGGVSVRMLRHYHEIGLLEPSYIDGLTGYRHYEAGQAASLRRIVALKSLGLTLTQVDTIINGSLTRDETRDLFLAQRDSVVADMAVGRATLEAIDGEVEALYSRTPVRRADSENEETMTEIAVELKSIEPLLVAQVEAVAKSWHPNDIGPVIQPLYPDLIARMNKAGVEPAGVTRAWYDDTDDGQVCVHATMELDQASADRLRAEDEVEFDVVELVAMPNAATALHHGPMSNCVETYEALLSWIDANGYRSTGYGREVDIECGPDGPVVTELQIPIESAAATV